MGCKQFRIKPDDPVDKNEEEKSIPTAPQVEIIQILPRDPNKTKSAPVVVYRNPLSLAKPLVVQSVISNGPEELSQRLPPIISRTPIKTNKSDEYHTTNNETLSQSGKPTPLKSMDSDMSDISEHSIITVGSDESDESYFVYRATTASTVGQENMAYRKDAMNRLMSGRPQRVNTCQESTRNNIGSDSDDRYSFCHSIASSVSADSEGSVVNPPPKGAKTVYFHPKQSNLQQKPCTHGSTSESDASELHNESGRNFPLREVQVMEEHLKTVLISKSAKLSSPDYNHRGVRSASTSEAEQF